MDSSAVKILRKAFEKFGLGQYSQVDTSCRRLLKQYPENSDALHLLSLTIKQQGHLNQALTFMAKSVELSPERAEFRGNLGNLFTQMGNFQQAETQYRKAISIAKDFRSARLGLMRVLTATARFQETCEQARYVLDRNKKDAQVWVLLGDAQRALSHYTDAESSYHQALAHQPDYALASHNLGALLAERHRHAESLGHLDRAQALGLKSPGLSLNQASSLMNLGRLDDAIELLEQSVNQWRMDIGLHTLLAKLQYMRGIQTFDEGLRCLSERHPDNAEIQLAYARVLRGSENLDGARRTLQKSTDRHPNHPGLLAEFSAVYQESHDFVRALQYAQTARQFNREDLGLIAAVIDPLISLGEAKKAMTLIKLARAQTPRNQWFIAMEATAARLLNDDRYHYLCDYEKLVGCYTLEPSKSWPNVKAFNEELENHLETQHKMRVRPLDQSLRHGIQTPGGLLNSTNPVMTAFFDMLVEPIRRYRESIGNDPNHPLTSRNQGAAKLNGCWSVRLVKNGFHVNHVHSQGWVSSAYYVRVPLETNDKHEQNGWLKFGEPRFPVPGVSTEHSVQPKSGLLVLFPSYMWHGTNPIQHSDPRLTIAFDIVCS